MIIHFKNQTNMITCFKNIKNHLDIQWHFLILAFKRYEITTLILYKGEGLTYGFELFSLDIPSMEYDTYCLLGVHLDYASGDELILVEVRLLWLLQFTISFKIQD